MTRTLIALALASCFLAVPETNAATKAKAHRPDSLVKSLLKQAPGLRSEVLRMAMNAAKTAGDEGLVTRRNLLTVIDYSLPSTQPRLFVFDLEARKLLFRELVAHGRNSGGNQANFFSNDPGSLASCLGLFVTADPYMGGNGYSLRLRGLQEGVNDMAWERAIVLHGAAYVSQAAVRALGRLGRSWGCPAVRKEIAHKLIDTLRGGSPVFAYFPHQVSLGSSSVVHAAAPTSTGR